MPTKPDLELLRQSILEDEAFCKVGAYLREQFAAPFLSQQRAIAMLSGGPDSTFLLYYLWATKTFGEFRVLHLNYQLRNKFWRRASDDDARFVRLLCERLQIPCYVEECPLKSASKNLQAEARNIRYEAARVLGAEHGATHLITAHHADDVVETFVLKLLQSSGLRGLGRFGSIEVFGGGGDGGLVLLRPMQHLFKSEVLAAMRRLGLGYRTDASNDSAAYLRNFVRRRVLKPLFHRSPPARQNLLRVASDLRQEFRLIERLVHQQFSFSADHRCVFVRKLFFELDRLEQRALLRHALGLFFAQKTFSRRAVEQMVRSMNQNEERVLFSMGSTKFAYSFGLIYPKSALNDEVFLLPGTTKKVGDFVVSLGRSNSSTAGIRVALPHVTGVFVRGRRAGDRLSLRSRRPKSIAALLMDEAISKHLRDHGFVVERNQKPIAMVIPRSPITQVLRANGWLKKEAFAWLDRRFVGEDASGDLRLEVTFKKSLQ